MIYHATVLSDVQARSLAAHYTAQVTQLGGEISASPTFGNGEPLLVLQLPEGVSPDAVGVPGVAWNLFGGVKEVVDGGTQAAPVRDELLVQGVSIEPVGVK